MALPSFDARVRRLASELFAPDPPPRSEVKADKAWIDTGRGSIWATHDGDKLTRLTILAHKYRLYAQIQILDIGLRILLMPRSADPQDPAFHPGLGDLVARAYAAAGATAPQADALWLEARKLLEATAPILESLASRTDEESDVLAKTRSILERTRTK